MPQEKIVGGFGQYIPSEYILGNNNVPIGSSGDIITITAPAGGRARLESLAAQGGPQAGISIIVDGVVLVSGGALGEDSASGSTFLVSQSGSMSAVNNLYDITAVMSDIVGSEIIVNAASNTVRVIHFFSSLEV